MICQLPDVIISGKFQPAGYSLSITAALQHICASPQVAIKTKMFCSLCQVPRETIFRKNRVARFRKLVARSKELVTRSSRHTIDRFRAQRTSIYAQRVGVKSKRATLRRHAHCGGAATLCAPCDYASEKSCAKSYACGVSGAAYQVTLRRIAEFPLSWSAESSPVPLYLFLRPSALRSIPDLR